jgi:hypothetical protein
MFYHVSTLDSMNFSRLNKRVLPNIQTFRTVDTATRIAVVDLVVSSIQFGGNARHVQEHKEKK